VKDTKLEAWQKLVVAGIAVARSFRNGGAYWRESGRALRKGIDQALREGARAAAETVRAEAEERRERKRRIGDGGHDPGAIVFYPETDANIEIRKYEGGTAWDRKTGLHLSAARWSGSYEYSCGDATLYESKGNYRVIAHLRGHWSPGWRAGEGEAEALTFTHAHPDGYFPHRDALYADALPLDRIALMLQAVHDFPHEKRERVPLVVIDNREAHRAEHARLAALEDPNAIRGKNGAGTVAETPSAVVRLAEPDPAVRYDAKARVSFDPRTGLRLETRSAGDRDYSFVAGTLHRGEEALAELTLHRSWCWRPGFGEAMMVNLNRARKAAEWNAPREPLGEEALALDAVVPLINAQEWLAWKPDIAGWFVIVDTRAEPINYMYG
jgi:hypothetical protein